MARARKETEIEVKERKEELEVYASPSWKLLKSGSNIHLISPSGFFLYEKEGLVKVKITVEEI